ncbi:hypothetical protein ACJRO7_025953 [Eucalyptus globulus]|uniref:Type II secretion system protein n=1 Tax=Eucalyptus globulus TaxID=34317 RepID=A0ABD3KBU4_EUCGL
MGIVLSLAQTLPTQKRLQRERARTLRETGELFRALFEGCVDGSTGPDLGERLRSSLIRVRPLYYRCGVRYYHMEGNVYYARISTGSEASGSHGTRVLIERA